MRQESGGTKVTLGGCCPKPASLLGPGRGIVLVLVILHGVRSGIFADLSAPTSCPQLRALIGRPLDVANALSSDPPLLCSS